MLDVITGNFAFFKLMSDHIAIREVVKLLPVFHQWSYKVWLPVSRSLRGLCFWVLGHCFFGDLCFCCNHRNVPFSSENQISYHNLFVCHLHLHQFLMIASLTPFRFFIVLHHYTSGCFLKVSADTILSSLSEWISKNSVIQQDQHQFCIFIWRSRVLSFRFGISFSTSLIINQEQVDNCSAIHEGL